MAIIMMAWGMAPAQAAEFQPLGYDAISMGGAGVASSRGSYSTYYNPALLARPRHGVEISLSPGIGFREANLVDHIDTLANIDVDATLDDLSQINYGDLSLLATGDQIAIVLNNDQLRSDVATIKRELRAMSVGGNGLELMPNVALAAQVGHWGMGAFMMAEATAYAVVDPQRLDIIVPYEYDATTTYYVKYDEVQGLFTLSDSTEYQASSLDYAVRGVNNKSTYVSLNGLAYGEVPVAYALDIPAVPGTLSVGGSVKFMTANTYSAIIDIDTESGDIQDRLKDSKESDSTFGMDLGVLYSPPQLSNLSLGLVAKNINSPEFGTTSGANLSIDPQIRAGAAMNLMSDTLTLAFDMDLSTNETFIKGYDTQYAGGGVSFHPTSWASLRAGAMKNLKESEEGLILTAGLGIGIKWFQLDLAGQMSTKSGTYDGTDIPRYGRIQLALVSKWN